MTVVVLEDAADDLESGRDFYDACEKGVGTYFVDSIFGDLERLANLGGIHPLHFGFRRMLCKRFPYAIYYQLEDESAVVYAILDLRRDPTWLRDQLEERE
jgi:plasmid stabilization system protein ParE